MPKQKEQSNFKLEIPVKFEQPPETEISLIGFLFHCNGTLLQQKYVKDNILKFNLDSSQAAGEQLDLNTGQLRLFIAPASEKNIQNVTTIGELERFKAYEPILTKDADENFSILPIPLVISQFWLLCSCRVTGKVSKWFHVGNTWVDRPVCRAKVHICEIDPIWYWIYRIPDYIIAKISKEILEPKEIIKFPVPTPDPPPFQPNEIREFAQQQQSQNIFKTLSIADKQKEATFKLPELGTEIKQNFASGNLNLIRETIAKNYTILHPWFCLWPWWWPYFYRCKELAVINTNANGMFDTNVSYLCFGDKPDIYIWVEYMINGVWTTVYDPPIPCNTFWDYACGTSIHIHVSDPRVPGSCCCDCPIPGELVWIRSVGSTSVTHINQSSYLQAPPGQSISYDRIGLTDASAIGDSFLVTIPEDYKRPFGGSPSLYMGFGSDLPNTDIYYYRWSYKQIANAQLASVGDSYKALVPKGDSVNKGYEYVYTDSNGDSQFGANSVKLGPFTVGANDNLYIIPPVQPFMAPFNVPESNPLWHEQTYNMNTISFDSAALKNGAVAGGDGLYQFKLELFDKSGNLLNNIPKETFKTPDHNDANFSVNAPDGLLENPTATTANAYNMRIRIDNGQCNADIFTVNVNGNPAALDCCGFASYKPGGVEADLELSFLATHPNNFAVFNFDVVKGTCGDVPVADANGMVIDSASGYTLSSGIYDKHFTPADLLGECYDDENGKAAFAETLRVIAMATDGTFRVTNDAGEVAAFALEP